MVLEGAKRNHFRVGSLNMGISFFGKKKSFRMRIGSHFIAWPHHLQPVLQARSMCSSIGPRRLGAIFRRLRVSFFFPGKVLSCGELNTWNLIIPKMEINNKPSLHLWHHALSLPEILPAERMRRLRLSLPWLWLPACSSLSHSTWTESF